MKKFNFALLPTNGNKSQLIILLEKGDEKKSFAKCPVKSIYFEIDPNEAVSYFQKESILPKEESSFDLLFESLSSGKDIDPFLVKNFLDNNLKEELCFSIF